MAKRASGEAAALMACARVPGACRDFARRRVLEHVRAAHDEPAALAVALGVHVRTAYRIIRVLDGYPPRGRRKVVA